SSEELAQLAQATGRYRDTGRRQSQSQPVHWRGKSACHLKAASPPNHDGGNPTIALPARDKKWTSCLVAGSLPMLRRRAKKPLRHFRQIVRPARTGGRLRFPPRIQPASPSLYHLLAGFLSE